MNEPQIEPQELGNYMAQRDLASKAQEPSLDEVRAGLGLVDPDPSPDPVPAHMAVGGEPAQVPKPGEFQDVARGAAKGAVNAVQEIGNTAIDIADFAENTAAKLGLGSGNLIPNNYQMNWSDSLMDGPTSMGGKTVSAITQFALPFAGVTKLTSGMRAMAKVGPLAAGMINGAAADFIAFDPKEERLSNFLKEVPWLGPHVFEYLAQNPNDSNLHSRFKQVLEGALMGATTEGAIHVGKDVVEGLGNIFRGYKLARDAKAIPQIAEGVANEAKAAGTLETPGVVPGAEVPKEAVPADLRGTPVEQVNSVVLDGKEVSLDPVKPVGAKVVDAEGKVTLAAADESTNIWDLSRKQGGTVPTTLEESTRSPITDKQLDGLSRITGLTPDKLRQRLAGQAANGETIRAAERILDSGADDLARTLEKLLDPSASDVDRLAAIQARETSKAFHMQVAGLEAEAGRSLRAIGVYKKEMDRDVYAKMLRDLIANDNGDINQMAQMYKEMRDKIGKSAANKQLHAAIRMSAFDRWSEVGMTWMTNGMMSSPKTMLRNIMGNTATLFTTPIEKAGARASTMVRDLWNHDMPRVAVKDGVAPGEVASDLITTLTSIPESLMVGGRAFATNRPSDYVTKYQGLGRRAVTEGTEDSVMGRAVDWFGTFSHRVNLGVDETFKAIHYRKSLYSQALQDVWQKGLQGAERSDAIAAFVKQPPNDAVYKALEEARLHTFQGRLSKGSESFMGALNFKTIGGVRPGRVVMPFVGTPLRLFEYGLERAPGLQFLSPQLWSDLRAGGRVKDMAMGRLALGAAIGGAGALYVSSGHITGEGPSDPRARKAWENVGWKPYSLKIGDDWYSYRGVEPLSNTLSAIADFSEIIGQLQDDRPDDVATATALVAGKVAYSALPQLLTETMTQVLDAINDPDKYGKRFIERWALGAVPYSGMSRYVREKTDPIKRDTLPTKEEPFGRWLRELRNSVPSFSQTLPAQLNMWGEEVAYDPGHSINTVSPQYGSRKDSPIRQEIVRLQLAGPFAKYDSEDGDSKLLIDMPPRIPTVMGIRVPLTPEEYHKYVKLSAGVGLDLADQNLEETLNQSVKDGYPELGDRAANPEARRQFITQRVHDFRDAALHQMLEDDDSLKERFENWKEMAQALSEDPNEGRGLVNHRLLGPGRSTQPVRGGTPPTIR